MVMFRPLILRGVAGANGQNQFGVWGVPLNSLNREVSKDRLSRCTVIQMQYCNCGKLEVHVKHPSYRNGDSSLLFFVLKRVNRYIVFFFPWVDFYRERTPISRFGFVFKENAPNAFFGGLQILATGYLDHLSHEKNPYYFPLNPGWLIGILDPYI